MGSAVSGGPEWTVPVVSTTPDAQRRLLRLVIVDGEVVIVTPSGEAWVLPVTSDDQLCDGVGEARRIANHLGRGLT